MLLGFCAALIVLSFAVSFWRRMLQNHMTKTLTSSWSTALFWFGVTGLFFTVCRVETIQFLSMRLLWLFWVIAAALYVFVQILMFRRRHYTVLERAQVTDERDKYLPKRRK